MRLIDADVLKKTFLNEGIYSDSILIAMIDYAKTVDPVRHGKWTPYDCSSGQYCSCCGEEMNQCFSSYCGNCGTKMDE